MNEVNLKLSVEEANILLNALGNMPYGQVYQLIAKIHEQASAQTDGISDEKAKLEEVKSN